MINKMINLQNGLRAVDDNTHEEVKAELMREILSINVNEITKEEDLVYCIDVVTENLRFPFKISQKTYSSLDHLLEELQDQQMKILNNN